MKNLSISDIMLDLKSAFREATYSDAELELIRREQQMKMEMIELEANYKGVLKENKDLKKQCDEFRRDNKAEVFRRSGFKEKLEGKEIQRSLEKIKGLEEEKVETEKRERKTRGEIEKYLQKIECLEKEKAETERREREVRGEFEKHLQKIECLEREKGESERGEGMLRGEIEKLLQKIECLEREKAETEREKRELSGKIEKIMRMIEGLKKEKAETERGEREVRGEMENLLQKIECLEKEKAETDRREREARGEIEEHMTKMGCLEDEKEKVFAESEKRKKTLFRFKDGIDDTLTEDSVLNLSGDQAKSKAAYDGDVEHRLDTNMKEKFNSHSIHTPKLSGRSTNPSMLFSGKPTASPIIVISDSDNDDEGVHSPHGLKRKRDSSGSSNMRLLDNANNKNFTRNRESVTPMELSYGYDQTDSRPLTAGQCSDEELEADASWQFEADMLNAFHEYPILTMKAVCALYRQQKTRGNGPYGLGQGLLRKRGFDAFYASRGTALAEFLLDGNSQGGLKKSVEELQLHDPKGLDVCKKIGNTHSRQLFEIYQRQEDPFFGPK